MRKAMRRQHLFTTLVLFLTVAFATALTACVSVQIPTGSAKKASDMTYEAPEKPFSEIQAKNSDRAWLSATTGNTISFLSECDASSDPSLEQIQSESLAALSDLQVENSQRLTYNSREALQTTAAGEVDGVPVKLKLLIFKKNNCNYTLSYGGVAKNFAAETSAFDHFVRNFKVP